MSPLVSNVNTFLSLLVVLGQIFVVVGVVALIGWRRSGLVRFIGSHALVFSFIVATTATLGSLFYSEIAGFTPCKLCWYQRILMYPEAILLGIALFKKEAVVRDYILTLAIPGALIAGYHYLLQIGYAPALPCSAVGFSESCSQRFVMTFGYITIPMMAFTAFLMIILFLIIHRIRSRN